MFMLIKILINNLLIVLYISYTHKIYTILRYEVNDISV